MGVVFMQNMSTAFLARMPATAPVDHRCGSLAAGIQRPTKRLNLNAPIMRYTDAGRAQWEQAPIAETKESVEERSDEHCATPSGRTGVGDPA